MIVGITYGALWGIGSKVLVAVTGEGEASALSSQLSHFEPQSDD